MRKLIRQILDYLDQRFPVKVKIAYEDLMALNRKLEALEVILADHSKALRELEQLKADVSRQAAYLGLNFYGNKAQTSLER